MNDFFTMGSDPIVFPKLSISAEELGIIAA